MYIFVFQPIYSANYYNKKIILYQNQILLDNVLIVNFGTRGTVDHKTYYNYPKKRLGYCGEPRDDLSQLTSCQLLHKYTKKCSN